METIFGLVFKMGNFWHIEFDTLVAEDKISRPIFQFSDAKGV